MDAKHALYASEAHSLMNRLENLLLGRFTVGHRSGVGVEATTTDLTQVRLGAVFGLSVLDRLDALTGWALGHPSITSRRRSHYPGFIWWCCTRCTGT
ncbi:IS1 related protein (plasmid) [Deinococcus geothermalis DSM 11300]|uniref:IS1 related protein n=1 Tax=Deinococcus geothermalis (strain DSM 11300 / CIP 105573 / AG-3a) TaxID=319795 RepID=Q1J3Q3_DEIGD|nr:IS1 related protein [Deinococcus geothermalis DSM 11300]